MMRIIFLIVFACSSLLTFSQDLIVTNVGDSINCHISEVKQDSLYFTYTLNGGMRNKIIPKSEVLAYKMGFFSQSIFANDKVVVKKQYDHFRLAVNGGYSYQLAKISDDVPSDFKNYINGLRSGYHIGGDVTYYFKPRLGVGVKYIMFKTSNSLESISVTDKNGNVKYGRMSDDLTITFIGPTFSARLLSNALILNASLGYIDYKDNKVVVDKYTMTGNTLGMVLSAGYDIKIAQNFMLGFQLAYLSGALTEYDLSNGLTTETIKLETDKYEALNRVDFSIGLRFCK